ncbi:MAG: transcriptional regulator [Desulfobulbaceae bacterium]|nr:MAG: transcriptional regulator [Desulfobulbaceae bacterium]
MEHEEFITIRKKLEKTQRDIAHILGTSVKAVSSYEQGWRKIPGHVERQILLLLSKKIGLEKKNCWDLVGCPEDQRERCPAWEFNSGDICWFINGTICKQKPQKNWHEKSALCRKCTVFKRLIDA